MVIRALLFAIVGSLGCAASGEPESMPIADTGSVEPEDRGVANDDTAEPEIDTAPPPASCSDGTRDGDETDLDCGGACPKCGLGRTCLAPTDCASGSCTDALCTCAALDDCPSEQNCVAGACVPAAASCAATKTAIPTAKDGEYWIKPAAGAAYRAYCDMVRISEICNEAGSAVTGRTREGSLRVWTGKGKLNHEKGICELWALAGPSNYPFDRLNLVLGQTMSTCQAFGFVADDTLGSCPYGSTRTNCGFTVATLYRYGNVCSGCSTGTGSFRNYTLQGPMSAASVLSNTTGTIKTVCKFR